MCIFNLAVSEVSGTKILVASTTDDRQLTVYTNTVAFGSSSSSSSSSSPSSNAMILPCPFTGKGKIELVDLSALPDLFKKATAAFPTEVDPSSRSSRSAGGLLSRNFLEVQTVGSYSVSIANTLNDLKRIDPSVFKLADNVAELLSAHYAQGFGFVVCKFNEGKEMHPIAYIHPRAGERDQLFVPTRHEHGPHGPAEPDWDHEIFSLSCTSEAGPTPYESAQSIPAEHLREGNVQDFVEQFLALRLLVPTLASKFVLRRQEINGHHENRDLIFDILPSFLDGTTQPSLEDADIFIKQNKVDFGAAYSKVVYEAKIREKLHQDAEAEAQGKEKPKNCLLQ